MFDGDCDLGHPERADIGRAVPVELHVGQRTGRPESARRGAGLDAGREPGVRRLGDMPLVVQRGAERGPAFGHDEAERWMQTAAGEEVDEHILYRPELSFEHAAEATLLVVLFHATEAEVQIPELRSQITRDRIA